MKTAITFGGPSLRQTFRDELFVGEKGEHFSFEAEATVHHFPGDAASSRSIDLRIRWLDVEGNENGKVKIVVPTDAEGVSAFLELISRVLTRAAASVTDKRRRTR